MNRDLINNPSQLNKKQARDILDSLVEGIDSQEIQTETSLVDKLFSGFKEFFTTLGKPSMKKRHVHPQSPPFSDIYNQTMQEVKNDLDNIFDESYALGEGVKKNFNHTIVERDKLRNKIKSIGELVSDYVVTAKGTIHKNIVIQDNFTSKDKVDESRVHGSKARVSTNDGIVTLEVEGSTDHSQGVRILRDEDGNLPGNGLPGNFGVAVKLGSKSNQSNDINEFVNGDGSEKNSEYTLLWVQDKHDDPTKIFDGEPNTWFEYSVVNVPEGAKKSPPSNSKYPDTKGYGWHFSDGEPIYYDPTDNGRKVLKLTIHVELPEVTKLNWISLNPYIPPGSGLQFTVLDVKTSVDDSKYVTVNVRGEPPLIIGSDTNKTPFQYSDVIDKYTGRGVWAFPGRDVKFVKIEMETDQSYELSNSTTGKAGHIFWLQSWVETRQNKYLFGLIKGKQTTTKKQKRVPGSKIDRRKFLSQFEGDIRETGNVIIDGLAVLVNAVTKIFVDEDVNISDLQVEPGLDIYNDGWRWAIGIRDINLYSFRYANSSVLISKRFSLPKPIDSISLSVSEMIPKEFYETNEASRNEWIRYYVSIDDGATWHRISPLEHQRVGPDIPLAPKIATINSKVPPDSRDQNKVYIEHEGNPTSVRLRVEFYRPSNSDPTLTPTLSHYQLRITPREE